MAGFFRILAASVGSGLVLGASIRMGEAIAASAGGPGRKARLRPTRASSPPAEWQTAIANLTERLDRQHSDVEAIRAHIDKAPDGGGLREGLKREIGDDLDRRLAAVEEKLHLRMKAATRETANAMAASIEMRVTPRIGRLETEVSGQSAALADLRACSLQSERSIQRLLTVLERAIHSKTRAESGGGPVTPSPEAPDGLLSEGVDGTRGIRQAAP